MAVRKSHLNIILIVVVSLILSSSGLFVSAAAVRANETSAGAGLDEVGDSPIPILIAPKGTIYDRTPTYKWSHVSNASKYWIQVKQSGIGVPFIDKDNLTSGVYCKSGTCSVTFPAELGYKLYKWRVIAYITGYWKQWSAWQPFVVAPSVGGFYTDFHNANGWAVHNGSWLLENNTYYTTTGKQNQAATISHTGNYSTLTYEARMKRTGCAGCANVLIIRGDPGTIDPEGWWYTEYTFDYTNNGLFSVWRDYHGIQNKLQDWTSTSAIKKGEWNILKVTAQGNQLKFYINGKWVWGGTDSHYASGRVGIGMFKFKTTDDKLRVDWAKLTTTVADAHELEVLVAGEEVPGGNHNESP
jgi:hypothetical protein